MTKAVYITGVAGSGKTSVCAELAKRGYRAYNIEEIKGLFSALDRRTGKPFVNYNDDDFEMVKYHDWKCDKNGLQELMQKNDESISFYCGIASNTDEILPLFHRSVLLKASPQAIRKRLIERKNNNFAKTYEVREWVLGRKDFFEDHMKAKGAIVIDADQSLPDVADDIIERTR